MKYRGSGINKGCVDGVSESLNASGVFWAYAPVILWFLLDVLKGAGDTRVLTRLVWLFEAGRLKQGTVRNYVGEVVRELEKHGVLDVVRRGSDMVVALKEDVDREWLRDAFRLDLLSDVFKDRLVHGAEMFKEAIEEEIGIGYYDNDGAEPAYIVAYMKALVRYARKSNGERIAYSGVVTFNRAVIGIPRLPGAWVREVSPENTVHTHGVFVVEKGDNPYEYLRAHIVKWLDTRLSKIPDPVVRERIRQEYLQGLHIYVDPVRGDGRGLARYNVKGVSMNTNLSDEKKLFNEAVLWILGVKYYSIRVFSETVKLYAEMDYRQFKEWCRERGRRRWAKRTGVSSVYVLDRESRVRGRRYRELVDLEKRLEKLEGLIETRLYSLEDNSRLERLLKRMRLVYEKRLAELGLGHNKVVHLFEAPPPPRRKMYVGCVV